MLKDFRNKFYTKLMTEMYSDNKSFKRVYAEFVKDLKKDRIINEYLNISKTLEESSFDSKEEAYGYLNDVIMFLKENKDELKVKIKSFSKKHLNDIKEGKFESELDCLLETAIGEFNAKSYKKINEAKNKIINILIEPKVKEDDLNLEGVDHNLLITFTLNKFNNEFYSKLDENDKKFFNSYLESDKLNDFTQLNSQLIESLEKAIKDKEEQYKEDLEALELLSKTKDKIEDIKKNKLDSKEVSLELYDLTNDLGE